MYADMRLVRLLVAMTIYLFGKFALQELSEFQTFEDYLSLIFDFFYEIVVHLLLLSAVTAGTIYLMKNHIFAAHIRVCILIHAFRIDDATELRFKSNRLMQRFARLRSHEFLPANTISITTPFRLCNGTFN